MPELPDIEAYRHALDARFQGAVLERLRISNPFLLRTIEPTPEEAVGRAIREFKRLGKRVAIGLDGGLWLVIHLMIAGRFHLRAPGVRLAGKQQLAAFDFPVGSLVLTEAGSKRRASLHIVNDQDLYQHDPGGIDPREASFADFAERLTRGNHTLKRVLTDPKLYSGIGNAYSDEILHRARLSPIKLTKKLTDEEQQRLYDATGQTLGEWVERLTREAERAFPEKVTAFRKEMAVHGKFGEPCPDCGTTVQRIRYADNETNYCPRCQTEGKILADRSLSRLLKDDWPRSIDELE